MNGKTKWKGPRKAEATEQKQWLENLRMKKIKIDYVYWREGNKKEVQKFAKACINLEQCPDVAIPVVHYSIRS